MFKMFIFGAIIASYMYHEESELSFVNEAFCL